jgi:hypothetical protein
MIFCNESFAINDKCIDVWQMSKAIFFTIVSIPVKVKKAEKSILILDP